MKLRYYLLTQLPVLFYKVKRRVFRWVVDEEGDVGLELFRCLTLLKYKESTLFLWLQRYPDAPKRF